MGICNKYNKEQKHIADKRQDYKRQLWYYENRTDRSNINKYEELKMKIKNCNDQIKWIEENLK